MTEKRIISIGRQFGSGGHSVGIKVAEELGIPFYDRQLINKIAEQSGYDEKFIQSMEDSGGAVKHRLSYFLMGRDNNGKTIDDYVWDAQKKVILDLSEKGPCVIVGRCSDYILREREDVLSVFIHADFDRRCERAEKRYGKTDTPIDRRVKDMDARRQARYEYCTGRKWGRAENYDICLNSGRLGIDVCVSTVLSLVKESR